MAIDTERTEKQKSESARRAHRAATLNKKAAAKTEDAEQPKGTSGAKKKS